jgi:hypothetical protein
MALYQDLRKLMLDASDPRVGVIAKGFASRMGSKMDSLCGIFLVAVFLTP